MRIGKLTAATLVALACTAGVKAGVNAEQKKDDRASAPLWKEAVPAPATQIPGFDPRQSLAPLVKQVKPAVVNIKTTKIIRRRVQPHGFGGDPMEEFFERFFGMPGDPRRAPPRGRTFEQRQQGQGSGFIINADGVALTNLHVVQDADEVEVTLADEREFEAKVVGRDPKSDLAILKLAGAKDLPTVVIGDSERLEVGDWVLAIGNPFGLAHTVSAGVVSAKPRLVGPCPHPGGCPYDEYIQTDAAINPGNSGGPLFNMRGEVVGINSFIFAPSGGNVGIGFAMPIHVAKSAVASYREHGRVIRGWLGVGIQPLNEQLARKFGLDKPQGALIGQVFDGSPAERAGLRAGDVVLEFSGRKVDEHNDLPRLVADAIPGSEATLVIWRDKAKKELRVKIGEFTEDGGAVAGPRAPGGGADLLGLQVRAAREGRGVEVTDLADESPAAGTLEAGDVILEVNRRPVQDVGDFQRAAADVRKGDTVLVRIRRGESTLFAAIPIK